MSLLFCRFDTGRDPRIIRDETTSVRRPGRNQLRTIESTAHHVRMRMNLR